MAVRTDYRYKLRGSRAAMLMLLFSWPVISDSCDTIEMNNAWDTAWNGQYNKVDNMYCNERYVYQHQLGMFLYHNSGFWLGYMSFICDDVNVIDICVMRAFDEALHPDNIKSVWQEKLKEVWETNEDLKVSCIALVEEDTDLSVGAIVGITLGALTCMVVIIWCLVYCPKWYKRTHTEDVHVASSRNDLDGTIRTLEHNDEGEVDAATEPSSPQSPGHDNLAYYELPLPSEPPPSYYDVINPNENYKYPTATLEELRTGAIPDVKAVINSDGASGEMDSFSDDNSEHNMDAEAPQYIHSIESRTA